MGNRIKTRFRVDWDNDTYTNLKVPTGLPVNLVPYAPYVEGMAGRSRISGGSYVDTAIKEVDDVGFTTLKTDTSLYASQEYGVVIDGGALGDVPMSLPSGTAHNFSIYLKSDVAQTVNIAIYSVNLNTLATTSLATDSYSVGTSYKRFATSIPSQGSLFYPLIILTPTNLTTFMYSKAMQITTGSSPAIYHVGETSSYDDITEYVLTADWKLGREDYDAPLAYEGTMTIVLNNDSQIFSPSNTASPLYGALEQNRRIALEVFYNGSWHPLWTGWTSRFNVKAGRTNNRQVELECMQGMYRLREGEFSASVEHDVYLHDVVYELVARSGWLSAKSPFGFVLNTNGTMGVTTYLPTTGDLFTVFDEGKQVIGTIGMDWGRETSVEEALKELLTSEYAKLMIGRDGGLILHNRNRIATPVASSAGAITLDTSVTNAEYVYGENILNRIEVMTKPKKEVTDEVIWETQSPIYLNGLIKRQRRRNKRKKRRSRRRTPDEVTAYVPMHFTFEEERQRTITNINTTMGSMNITVTHARRGHVIPESKWAGQIWAAILSDGGNKYILQVRNNRFGAVNVNVQVTGDYYEGGQGQSYLFEDEESQEQLGAVFYELREVTVMDDDTQAQALAQLDLARRSKPQGEIKSMEFSSYDEDTMITMMTYTLGDVLNITEKQSGISAVPHQIIGESGSYASGDVLRLGYTTAHMNIAEYTKIDTGECRARTNLSPYPNIMDADFTATNKLKADVVKLISDAGESAWKFSAYTNQAMAWFGGGNADVFYSYNRRQRYNDYATNILSATKTQPTISEYEYSLPRHIQGLAFYHPCIGELTGGGGSSPSASFPKIMQIGTWWIAATVYGTATNIIWESSEGDIWGTPVFNETRSRSYGSISYQTAKREYYNPYYNKKLFLYLYPVTGGGTDDYYISDITAVNLQNLENMHLEASTQYTVSVWGQSEFGQTTDIAIVAVEHDGSSTPTEHVVTMTLGEYGKYTGTFTTTASCDTVALGIRWDDTAIPPVPCYITGLSITESSVSDLDDANEILPTAMRLFV